MNNLWRYLGVSLIFFGSLLINSCSLISLPITRAETEKLEADNMPLNKSPMEKGQGQNLPISAQLLINEQKIDLEVAQTSEQQQLGLMYRSFLPDNRGMLFPFPQATMANFWMKNVDISLDMIFVANGVVDSVAHNVPPCKKEPCPIYRSEGFVDQVIELAGGRAQELQLQKGDRLKIIFLNSEDKK